MRLYLYKYQDDIFTHKKKSDWRKYGVTSLFNLIKYLGYPREEDLALLDSCLRYEEYDLGTVLIAQGEKCDQVYFIIKGTIRLEKQHDDKVEIIGFAANGNLVSSFIEFVQGGPAPHSVVTCCKTRCLVLKKEDLDKIAAVVNGDDVKNALDNLFNKTLEYYKWVYQNFRLSPIERIKNIYLTFPEIFNSVTDTDLASYLAMARGTFSRLKKEMLREV